MKRVLNTAIAVIAIAFFLFLGITAAGGMKKLETCRLPLNLENVLTQTGEHEK